MVIFEKLKNKYNKYKFNMILKKFPLSKNACEILIEEDFESNLVINKLTMDIEIVDDATYYYCYKKNAIFTKGILVEISDICHYHINISQMKKYSYPFFINDYGYHVPEFKLYVNNYQNINYQNLTHFLKSIELYLSCSWHGNYKTVFQNY